MKIKFYFLITGMILLSSKLIATDPVVYLPFSGDLINYGSNSNNYNAATAVNASNGQAISFETQTGQYNCAIFPAATIADTSSVVLSGYKGILGSNARSISFWIKTTVTSTNNKLVTWGDRTGGNYKKWCVRLEDAGKIGAVRVEMTGNYITGTTQINDGNWHHVAISYASGGTLGSTKIYVDGNPETFSAQNSGAIPATSAKSDVAIGRENTGYNVANSTICYFNGRLSKLKIWDVAISSTEVATEFSETPGLVVATGFKNTSTQIKFITSKNTVIVQNNDLQVKTVSFYNLNGTKVSTHALQAGNNNFHIESGIYIALISDNEGKVHLKK